MKITTTLAGLAVIGLMISPAMAGAPVKTGMTTAGKVLMTTRGMTLYVFDKDKKGVSNCNGGCAAKWPPLMAGAMAKKGGGFSAIKRADGKRQWAYKGKALYGWVYDRKPGDVTGDGVKGVWHAARP